MLNEKSNVKMQENVRNRNIVRIQIQKGGKVGWQIGRLTRLAIALGKEKMINVSAYSSTYF